VLNHVDVRLRVNPEFGRSGIVHPGHMRTRDGEIRPIPGMKRRNVLSFVS